jgi:hypothetical protein
MAGEPTNLLSRQVRTGIGVRIGIIGIIKPGAYFGVLIAFKRQAPEFDPPPSA